jgi:hypothetical protein
MTFWPVLSTNISQLVARVPAWCAFMVVSSRPHLQPELPQISAPPASPVQKHCLVILMLLHGIDYLQRQQQQRVAVGKRVTPRRQVHAQAEIPA